MKFTLAALALVFAVFQIDVSQSKDIGKFVTETIQKCIDHEKLDRETVLKQLKEDEVPATYIDLYGCLMSELDIEKGDGEFDFEKLRPIMVYLLKEATNIDDLPKIERITDGAIEHCKDTPKRAIFGERAIELRNCMRVYARNNQD